MRIIIVHAGGEHRVRTESSSDIYQLKLQLFVDLRIEVEKQSLRFNGEFLKNENRVGDYQITEGSRILLQQGIPIFINTPATQFWLIVEETTTVKNLKEKIQMKTGIPAEHMKLLVGHTVMDDYYAMYTYGICEGSEISVILPIRSMF